MNPEYSHTGEIFIELSTYRELEMSGENNRAFTSAIGLYIFIAVMVAVLVAATAPSYLKMPEVSFLRRILLFFFSVPVLSAFFLVE